MDSKIKLFFYKVFTLLSVFMLGQLLIACQIQAEGLLTSMDELPPLQNETITSQAQDTQSALKRGERITILYNDDGQQHNIGELGLSKEKFNAGESVSGDVDVLELKPGTNLRETMAEIEDKESVLAVDSDDEIDAKSITATESEGTDTQQTGTQTQNTTSVGKYPNDVFLRQQIYLNHIGADLVWSRLPQDKTVKVALLDTGVNSSHIDLRNRVETSGKDFVYGTANLADVNGHGTEVAGIIAAQTNNVTGIAGASGLANVKIVPYRVLGADSTGRISTVAAAIRDAAARSDIKIIHMSLGFKQANGVLYNAIRSAMRAGKIIVASSGNSNQNVVEYPARFSEVIGVGAINSANQRCSQADWGYGQGSNFGEGLDVCAPGTEILTTSHTADQEYTRVTGTSFSAAMVTACCVACLTKNPNITPEGMKEIIRAGAQDINLPGRDAETGYGLARMDRMLNVTPSLNSASNQNTTQQKQSSKLALNQSQAVVNQGGQITLVPVNTSGQSVKWSSSNEKVAKVQNGQVQAVGVGTAKIRVAAQNNSSQNAVCNVTVVTGIQYKAHEEDGGWTSLVEGPGIAGTQGQNKPINGIMINPLGNSLDIQTQVYVSNTGWMDYVSAGDTAGLIEKDLPIEAVRFRLVGENASLYDLSYRVHCSGYGWTSWASTGQPAGTQGHNLPIEAFQLMLVKKGARINSSDCNVNWTFAQ